MESRQFDEKEWDFERSSGFPGYRNRITGKWVYSDDYETMKNKSGTVFEGK